MYSTDKNFGFVRIAAAIPKVHVGNPSANVKEMFYLAKEAEQQKVQVLVFPELGITGYTCGELFGQHLTHVKALKALNDYAFETRNMNILSIVGMPLILENKMFNVAIFIHDGRILAVVPKSHVPNYKEFYEGRWFHPASELQAKTVTLFDREIPIGTDIIVEAHNNPLIAIGVDICEDIWMPMPPSARHALHGATILANLSASNGLVGKADYRRKLVISNSGRSVAAQIYVSAGPWESSSDVVFDGHAMIAINGTMIAKESKRFSFEPQILVADVDVEALMRERVLTGTFGDASTMETTRYRKVKFNAGDLDVTTHFLKPIDPHPFVPKDPARLDENCEEVFSIQVTSLARRLRSVFKKNAPVVTIGISGGLDSTLALLATVRTFVSQKWDLKNIHAITMPGPGTTSRTLTNAIALCEKFGVSLETISIEKAVVQHLYDIGHEPCWDCLACENAQARERTQILMDKGFMIGTGDLSEAALGWCTYGGDQLSMYNVNAQVPKTLIRHIVAWEAKHQSPEIEEILTSILGTPISPELRKSKKANEITQKTEDVIGPYELHDFFLFHMVRNGFTPEKILFLAGKAFAGIYDRKTILRWMRVFYTRFFDTQFKRDAVPNGPKVGSVSLSPRGDWRMPSDINGEEWLAEVERLYV